MPTQAQYDALRAQVKTALGVFQASDIKRMANEEEEAALVAAEAAAIAEVRLPSLPAAEFEELLAFLVSQNGPPFDPQKALMMAYRAGRNRNQPNFWRAVFAFLHASLRAHPEVRRDRQQSVEFSAR